MVGAILLSSLIYILFLCINDIFFTFSLTDTHNAFTEFNHARSGYYILKKLKVFFASFEKVVQRLRMIVIMVLLTWVRALTFLGPDKSDHNLSNFGYQNKDYFLSVTKGDINMTNWPSSLAQRTSVLESDERGFSSVASIVCV